MAHACARPGCLVELPDSILACRQHWYELPARIRSRIVRAWAVRHAGGDAGPHLEAVSEAIAFWTEPAT